MLTHITLHQHQLQGYIKAVNGGCPAPPLATTYGVNLRTCACQSPVCTMRRWRIPD